MLNNLSKVGWSKENPDIICYMLTTLVYLQQGYVKKSKKIINIDKENLDVFRMTWGIPMKFSEKNWIIKSHEKPGFYVLSRNTVWKKPQEESNWPLASLSRVKDTHLRCYISSKTLTLSRFKFLYRHIFSVLKAYVDVS